MLTFSSALLGVRDGWNRTSSSSTISQILMAGLLMKRELVVQISDSDTLEASLFKRLNDMFLIDITSIYTSTGNEARHQLRFG